MPKVKKKSRDDHENVTVTNTCNNADLPRFTENEIIHINNKKNELISIDDEILNRLHDANIMSCSWRDYFKELYKADNLIEQIKVLKVENKSLTRQEHEYMALFDENMEHEKTIKDLKAEIDKLNDKLKEQGKQLKEANKKPAKSKFEGGRIPGIDNTTQNLIIGRYINGQDAKTIAEKEKVSLNTVKKYIQKYDNGELEGILVR